MPVGDACEMESRLYGDFRGREFAEGLLDFLIVGEVLPEECLASGSGTAGGRIEVYWGPNISLSMGCLSVPVTFSIMYPTPSGRVWSRC